MLINQILIAFALLAMIVVAPAQAGNLETDEYNSEYYRLASEEMVNVESNSYTKEISQSMNGPLVDSRKSYLYTDTTAFSSRDMGKVIMVSQGLVGLGEGVYGLIQKGKPSINTYYAPISVMPKVGNDYVDILETEFWRYPKRRTYTISIKNGWGAEVVKFRFSVIYSYGGSYQGVGSYITAAQIIPEYVLTSFGFDLDVTMKLNGIQNHGTKANPIAGAILTMEYSVKSVMSSSLKSKSFHITGRGDFTHL